MMRQMRLGLSMRGLGYHVAAWRHPGVPADGSLSYPHFLRSAQEAERGKFDMIFFADGIGIRTRDEPKGSQSRSGYEIVELEPLTLLSALAPMTSRIGLVCTASTTYNEPYHIARKFASLDHISGGRAGWNIVTSWSEAEAKNFNREHHLDYETRYARASEFVEVVTGLWNSWEDDAFLYDKASARFYDEAKMHTLNHKGEHFSVRGPLSSARTPQGRPILVQAGASVQGLEIAAQHADVVYAMHTDLPAAQAYYADLKGRMAKYGREQDHLKIMPAIIPVVGATEAEAQRKFDELQELLPPLVGLARLYGTFGDLSGYDLDGPLPEPVGDPEMRSGAQRLLKRARDGNLTIRQLSQIVAGGSAFRVIGTPEQIADQMEAWFRGNGADGFNITPTHLPAGIEDFVEMVVPELQRRGLFRTEYEGATLRENLGLPAQIYRTEGAEAAAPADALVQ